MDKRIEIEQLITTLEKWARNRDAKNLLRQHGPRLDSRPLLDAARLLREYAQQFPKFQEVKN